MVGFTKLFSTLVHSTVWREDLHVKVVWVTLLALADRNGVVSASIPGLADAARVSLDQCLEALSRFKQPDPYSRTKDHEGRRIEDTDGGWKILNHAKYRRLLSSEDRRENVRLAVGRYRDRQRAPVVAMILERDGSVCGVCGEAIDSNEATIDHIVPRTKGGADTVSNLQLAHESCNKGKNNGREGFHRRHPSLPVITGNQCKPGKAQAEAEAEAENVSKQATDRPGDDGERLLRASRIALEREFYRLVSEIAKVEPDKDPPDIARTMSSYTSKDGKQVGGKMRPETLSDEHLERSIKDGRAWLEACRGKSA